MNNMQIIYSADYGMGIGDFLVKLYAICHLKQYIAEKYNCEHILILEEYFSNLLNNVLDIDFFKSYFDRFIIQNKDGEYCTNLGRNNIHFENSNFNRRYSAINDYTNDRRGYWEIYSNFELNDIPYHTFDYRDPSSRQSQPIPDYNLSIFKQSLHDVAQNFVNNNLQNNFDCIYYRTLTELDLAHLNNFISKIQNNVTNQTIFVTSNSETAKKYISNSLTNKCITYKSIDLNKTDGYGTSSSDADRLWDLIVEMIIMSYAKQIHYGGNHTYISLFNYYAHLVKQIPLISY